MSHDAESPTQRARMTRREFLSLAAKWSAGAGFAGAAYGGLFERTHIVLRRVEVRLDRLPEAMDGLTIAQISDLHYDRHFSAGVIRRGVELIAELKPDLVALTGDFVTVPFHRKYDRDAAVNATPCAELLAPLRAPLGVYAVLGNHDSHTDPGFVTGALTDHGIRVLQNEALPLERNNSRVWLAGVGDVLTGFAHLKDTLKSIPSSEATILLAHEPDFADEAARHPVDLQLSGHSHGGQVRYLC